VVANSYIFHSDGHTGAANAITSIEKRNIYYHTFRYFPSYRGNSKSLHSSVCCPFKKVSLLKRGNTP